MTSTQTLLLLEAFPGKPSNEIESAWAEFLAGSSSGGERLYDALGDEMYGLALWATGSRADAADVVQTVFLKVLERRSRLGRVRRPRPYLLQMARSAAFDLLRQRRSTTDIDSAVIPDLVSDPNRELDASRVSRLIYRLPHDQRVTVYLRHFSELSFRQIGAVTGVSMFTAASRYRLALRRLRRWVEEVKR